MAKNEKVLPEAGLTTDQETEGQQGSSAANELDSQIQSALAEANQTEAMIDSLSLHLGEARAEALKAKLKSARDGLLANATDEIRTAAQNEGESDEPGDLDAESDSDPQERFELLEARVNQSRADLLRNQDAGLADLIRYYELLGEAIDEAEKYLAEDEAEGGETTEATTEVSAEEDEELLQSMLNEGSLAIHISSPDEQRGVYQGQNEFYDQNRADRTGLARQTDRLLDRFTGNSPSKTVHYEDRFAESDIREVLAVREEPGMTMKNLINGGTDQPATELIYTTVAKGGDEDFPARIQISIILPREVAGRLADRAAHNPLFFRRALDRMMESHKTGFPSGRWLEIKQKMNDNLPNENGRRRLVVARPEDLAQGFNPQKLNQQGLS